jgi:hypothetical protein
VPWILEAIRLHSIQFQDYEAANKYCLDVFQNGGYFGGYQALFAVVKFHLDLEQFAAKSQFVSQELVQSSEMYARQCLAYCSSIGFPHTSMIEKFFAQVISAFRLG